MSDVQKKDVLQQNDANPIPIGQYTISKMLGIKTVDISPKYNSEKVYSALFEELKDRELDAYQTKYKSTNRNIDLENRFREILGQDKNKSISAIFKDIEEKVNRMITDNYENEIPVNADKLTDCMKKTISHDSLRISWFEKHSRPSNEEGRLALYKISFAFNLNMEDHRKLFTYVFKLKPYLRTPAEFCLTYAKEHNMEYSEAVNLYCKYFSKRIKSGNIPASETKSAENYSGTRTLMKEVLDNESDNDHEKFICKLLSVSGTLNVTRKTIEQKIFDIAIAENGKKTVIFCDDDLMRYGLDSLKALMSKFYKGMYDTGNREVKSKNSKENKSEKNKNKESQRKPNPQAEFLISIESAFKDKDNKKPVGSKAILQLRKIYIICRTYQMWNSFDKEDEYKNIFTGFYNTLSRDLIKINLPQLDYLDDFDRGIILATAYRLHNNTTKSLGDLIDEIVKK